MILLYDVKIYKNVVKKSIMQPERKTWEFLNQYVPEQWTKIN
jgi:hypothetical protein